MAVQSSEEASVNSDPKHRDDLSPPVALFGLAAGECSSSREARICASPVDRPALRSNWHIARLLGHALSSTLLQYSIARLSNPLDQARDSVATAVQAQVCKCGVSCAASPPDQYALRMSDDGAHKKGLQLRTIVSRRQDCSVDRSLLVACQRRA